jgi:hypothetical protein
MLKNRSSCTSSIAALTFLILSVMTVPTPAQQQDTLSAQEAAWINEMPDPKRVLADIQGSDVVDTRARQIAALNVLSKMIDELRAGKPLPPEQQKIKDSFAPERNGPWQPTFDPAQNGKYSELFYRYEGDQAFRDELLRRYFSPQWQKHYHEVYDAHHAPPPQGPSKAEMRRRDQIVSYIIIAIALPIIVVVAIVFGRSLTRLFGKSEYRKWQEGDATVFAVTRAAAPKNTYVCTAGVIIFLIGWICPAPVGFIVECVGAAFFVFGLLIDHRPRAHKRNATFRVTSQTIQTRKRVFKKADIHRLITKNGLRDKLSGASYVTGSTNLGGQLAEASQAAGWAHMERQARVAWSLDLESGGKAHVLAGGMDETTAYGLLQDVSKIIGFDD